MPFHDIRGSLLHASNDGLNIGNSLYALLIWLFSIGMFIDACALTEEKEWRRYRDLCSNAAL